MQLYPKYFKAVLLREKTYEGRAYYPESDKNYHDISEGDSIIFNICPETIGWENDCSRLELNPNMQMTTEVTEVNFAPTVHWMFQYGPCFGEEFQPMINGSSELLYIQRAAVYYSFPNYKERIDKYGFLGLKLAEPKLV